MYYVGPCLLSCSFKGSLARASANLLVAFLLNNSLSGHCFFLASRLTIVSLDIYNQGFKEYIHMHTNRAIGKTLQVKSIPMIQSTVTFSLPDNTPNHSSMAKSKFPWFFVENGL